MESETPNNENTELENLKSSHRRKKHLYQMIQERMEFYFSDANLSKDRFMTNLLNEDPNIELTVFLKFNKIRSLTTNPKDIAKALKKSTLLSVSEDKTKVSRTVPVKIKENVDECTIYVEQLPLDADHEWLKNIFSQYGKVEYISIPKFKHNGKIKGFAFIEFESTEGAQKALDAFSNAGCKLPSTILPNQLCSVVTFDRSEKDVIKNRKLFSLSSQNKPDSCSVEEIDKRHSNKRKAHDSDSPVLEKTPKLEISSEVSYSSTEEVSKKNKKKRVRIADDELLSKENSPEDHSNIAPVEEAPLTEKSRDENCDSEPLGDCETDQKKKKKRRKKKKNHHKKEKFDAATSGLQILSKCEWKKLRNKYLELQRSKMNSLKQYLAKIKHDDNQHRLQMDKTENSTFDNSSLLTDDGSKTARVKFTPGVILKLTFDEPVIDVKAFKNEVKSHEGVEYVEVNEGSFVAIVRCSNNDVAKQLNTEKLWPNSVILEGEDESSYWNKIFKDREEKLSKKIRVNQKGRTKLLKKAEKALGKRIRFDSE